MIVAGTGHRPPKLGGYSRIVYENLVHIAQDHLVELETTIVISGMALGWDQALAQAAVNLGIPYIAAIPCYGHSSTWPKDACARYERLLAQASSQHIISPQPYSPYLMQKRNEWMVDHAALILAMWDGSNGGTANCIRYAESQHKKIINLWSEYERYIH
jgi:uncharacterized phage-like protein YoqJ